jgi:hypothetical protein
MATKRLSFHQKIALAQRITEVAVAFVIRNGTVERIDQTGGTQRTFKRGRFMMLYTTPESLFIGTPAPYGLDIWNETGKVFSAWWEPFEVIGFRRGDWVHDLVPDAPSLRQDG